MIDRRSVIGGLSGGLSAASGLSLLSWAARGDAAFASVSNLLQSLIAEQRLRGAQVLVVDRGQVVFAESLGLAGVSGDSPMTVQTVLSIQSLTKPIIATAIMMLAERNKLSIDDPVARYIPELAALNKVRVLKPGSPTPYRRPGPVQINEPALPEPEYSIVPAEREITLKDLLTHTAGLQQIDLPNAALPPVSEADTLATWVPKVAVMPLDHQPGSAWGYSNIVSFDVLARVVEVASMQAVDVFLQEHILRPLNMPDTGFGARYDQRASRAETMGASTRPAVAEGKAFKSGAAGLWSTLHDYARFMQMLANGGTLHGQRLLKPATVKLMTGNQVGNIYRGDNVGAGPGKSGLGFGLSLQLVLDAAAANMAVPTGSYGWNGAGGAKAWVIPNQPRVLMYKISAPPAQEAVERAVMAVPTQRSGTAL